MSYRLYGAHGSGSAIIEALLTEAGARELVSGEMNRRVTGLQDA